VVGDATGERPPLEALKQSPIWPLLYRNALSIPAELQALWAYHFEPHQFDAFTVPTVLFLGTASRGGIVQTQLEALHRALPTSVVEYLQGQGHGAIFEGPVLFATRLIEFWVR
jgi:pimeloyl-ACP methyl ester carboxylesterase